MKNWLTLSVSFLADCSSTTVKDIAESKSNSRISVVKPAPAASSNYTHHVKNKTVIKAKPKPQQSAHKPYLQANQWLWQQAREIDNIDITPYHWEGNIGLDDSDGVLGLKTSDRKTIQRILGTLRCTGNLSHAHDATASDWPGGSSLVITLTKNGKWEYLYLFKSQSRYRLLRRGDVQTNKSDNSKDPRIQGVATVSPRTVRLFNTTLHSLAARSRSKDSKVEIYEHDGD